MIRRFKNKIYRTAKSFVLDIFGLREQLYHYHSQRDLYFKLLLQSGLRRIVVGASNLYDDGWIPTEINLLNLLTPDQWQQHMEPDFLDALLAEHVWEHLSQEEGIVAAKTCFRYLKSGGYLRVAVPDGFHPSTEYINHVDIGRDGHQILYTYQTLAAVMETAGFKVTLYEYFDENHKFHYADWNPEDGKIRRSKRFDQRNADGQLRYTSIILDALKE